MTVTEYGITLKYGMTVQYGYDSTVYYYNSIVLHAGYYPAVVNVAADT